MIRGRRIRTNDLIGGRTPNFAYILTFVVVPRMFRCRPNAGAPLVPCRFCAPAAVETAFDVDIRQVEARGLASYADSSETELPQLLDRHVAPTDGYPQSPYFRHTAC